MWPIAYLNGSPGDVEHVLCLYKHIIPKACFLVALHLWEVEVWTCHKTRRALLKTLCSMKGRSTCHNSKYQTCGSEQHTHQISKYHAATAEMSISVEYCQYLNEYQPEVLPMLK